MQEESNFYKEKDQFANPKYLKTLIDDEPKPYQWKLCEEMLQHSLYCKVRAEQKAQDLR